MTKKYSFCRFGVGGQKRKNANVDKKLLRVFDKMKMEVFENVYMWTWPKSSSVFLVFRPFYEH